MTIIQIIGIIFFICFICFLIAGFKLKKNKKTFLGIALILFFCAGICVYIDDPNTFNNDESTNTNDTKTQVEKGSAKTPEQNLKKPKEEKNFSIQWADKSNYMFAIENENFDGDVAPSGKYKFYITAEIIDDNHTPNVWDIYVSKNMYGNQRELKKSEYVNSAGGLEVLSFETVLEKGDYVYVKFNDTILKSSGILNIEKINE